jgi:hypothetical protein
MGENHLSCADPFCQIADEAVEAYRQGKHPSVEEFARRYAEYADKLRDMLPALVLMKKAKSADDTPGQRQQVQAAAASRKFSWTRQAVRPSTAANSLPPTPAMGWPQRSQRRRPGCNGARL